MKITINSKREQELLQKFSEFIVEYLGDINSLTLSEEYGYDFQQYELEFLRKSFQEPDIILGEEVDGIYLHSEYLTGICKYCGKSWNGIEEIETLSIEEYESYLKERDLSYHIECFKKVKKQV